MVLGLGEGVKNSPLESKHKVNSMQAGSSGAEHSAPFRSGLRERERWGWGGHKRAPERGHMTHRFHTDTGLKTLINCSGLQRPQPTERTVTHAKPTNTYTDLAYTDTTYSHMLS